MNHPRELSDAERREITDLLMIVARREADGLDVDLVDITGPGDPVLVSSPVQFELVWPSGWRCEAPIDAIAFGVAYRRNQQAAHADGLN